MLRVLLVATDPDLDVSQVTAPLSDWDGEPIALVLISLHPVSGRSELDPLDAWSPSHDPAVTMGVRAYREAREAASEPVPPQAISPRKEATAQDRGHWLWDLVSDDVALVPVLEGADAIAATDLGGIRSAFHLARRHGIDVATNGLVPCLIELAARASAEQAQSWDDSGGESEPARPL